MADTTLHPADETLRRYIELRKARDAGNDIQFEKSWLADFMNKVNMAVHDTRIRFGLASMLPWRRIDLHALAPSRESGMETLQLSARIDGDGPGWRLLVFDNGMSLRAEYVFESIVDPGVGLSKILESEYGELIRF